TVRTRGPIGARELGLMKPDAILVNVARGAIVDEGALYEHLRTSPEFRAGLDVWWHEPADGGFRTDHPFFELPNFLGSPHNSAIVPGVLETAARRAAENVGRYLRGEPFTGLMRREDYEGASTQLGDPRKRRPQPGRGCTRPPPRPPPCPSPPPHPPQGTTP